MSDYEHVCAFPHAVNTIASNKNKKAIRAREYEMRKLHAHAQNWQ